MCCFGKKNISNNVLENEVVEPQYDHIVSMMSSNKHGISRKKLWDTSIYQREFIFHRESHMHGATPSGAILV